MDKTTISRTSSTTSTTTSTSTYQSNINFTLPASLIPSHFINTPSTPIIRITLSKPSNMFTTTPILIALAATLTTTTAQIRVGGPCGSQPGTPPTTGRPATPLDPIPGFELMTIPIASTTGRNLQPYSGLFLSTPAGVPMLSNNQSAATYLDFNAATGDIFYYNRTVVSLEPTLNVNPSIPPS